MAARGDVQSAGNRYSGFSTVSPSASVTYKPLLAGTSGTLQTLGAMREAVTIGLPPEYVSYRDGSNQRAALTITAHAPADVITALYEFARDRISYIDHPWNMQVVQDAKRTLEKETGDCVSKSVLLSTLLASLGINSRFVAQASTPDGFDHVYVEAEAGGAGNWIALDPTADGRDGRPRGDVGWTQRLADGGFEMAYSIF
jgi:transglutaminase-like putative cysteine protease